MGKRADRHPRMLPEPLQIYSYGGKYPDILRVAFADGKTKVYDLRVEQPHPLIEENIRIIRKMVVGYQAKREPGAAANSNPAGDVENHRKYITKKGK